MITLWLFILFYVHSSKMAYQMLRDVNSEKESWILKVQITRLWNARNINNNTLISLDMLLLDEQVQNII